MSDPIVTPEPNDDELQAAWWEFRKPAIESFGADQMGAPDAMWRIGYTAGFAAGRVLPSVEELAEVIREEVSRQWRIDVSLGQRMDNVADAATRAVIAYLTTKGNN